jgi:aldose 1-epimerase
MKVNGKNAFYFPFQSVGFFKTKPAFVGNPFLAPWANRLDSDGFWANGVRYTLQPELKNYRRDGFGQPIHGLLAYSPEWKVAKVTSDADGAAVTSRLEFWRYPDYMKQFPFAHTIDMTYRLRDGELEVETVIENLSESPMPVSVAFHPYFQIHDAPRDEWKVQLPAREQVILSDKLTPTGERRANPYSSATGLKGVKLDDVFTSLTRNESGFAEFAVQGKAERISVLFGETYPVAVVYAPEGRDFICFEPMSGVTNAFNLHHDGKYAELQTIPPGQKWRGTFVVRTEGF